VGHGGVEQHVTEQRAAAAAPAAAGQPSLKRRRSPTPDAQELRRLASAKRAASGRGLSRSEERGRSHERRPARSPARLAGRGSGRSSRSHAFWDPVWSLEWRLVQLLRKNDLMRLIDLLAEVDWPIVLGQCSTGEGASCWAG
jgi:hypothetical protein